MAGGAASVLRSNPEQHSNKSAAISKLLSSTYSRNAPNFVLASHSEALLHGLNALRCADKLFDVTLIVEGKTFKAHRVVLAACSDYFCAMFTDAMREARQSEIKLNGVNARGIELLIEYAYTSKLELDRNNVQDVLSVSTHVQMKAVIEACSNYLESQIDLENCVAIAVLADLYALDTLKRKTYRFICSRLDEFSLTADLLNLTWDQLEYILSCNYPVDCSEKRVLQIATQYCVETGLKAELAHLLFSHVRFNQIEASALKTLLSTLEDEDKENKTYVKLIRAEINKHEQNQIKMLSSESENEVISTDILTNSRGMELALVKIGGFETSGLTNQISCYLPSVGKWEGLTAIPHIEQCNYGTAVLGNDLYIVGGSYDVCLKEYIHPFGFRYCPTKDKWKNIAPIQADRCRFSLNAMGSNFLYAVGGVCELNDNDDGGDVENWGNDMAISNCERYNATTDRWEYLPALSENRSQHAGVVLANRLYISGGIDRHIVLVSLWCFDTHIEKWIKLRSMPTPRADHILIALDQHIYACGGWYEDPLTETRSLAQTIDVYDVNKDCWSTETTNPMPKYYTGVAAVKRRIYFIGGLLSSATINRATTAVQCYDLDTKQWSFNVEWEYPSEVWECTLAAFYVPRERDDFINVEVQT
ncbi:kelch-like protein 26 isoform 1-T5 [Glossina fuscipes fuscipes]|uniref:Kelch-like protein diablo n=1 Tax=Glossina palpalis gambiensis TaxID=67801 RepID=A0A1B0BHS0_9MUSC